MTQHRSSTAREVPPLTTINMHGSPTTGTGLSPGFKFPPDIELSGELSAAATAELVATNLADTRTHGYTAKESYKYTPVMEQNSRTSGGVPHANSYGGITQIASEYTSCTQMKIEGRNDGSKGNTSGTGSTPRPGGRDSSCPHLDVSSTRTLNLQQQASCSEKEESPAETFQGNRTADQNLPERGLKLDSLAARAGSRYSRGAGGDADVAAGSGGDYLQNEESYGPVGVDGNELYQTLPAWQQAGGANAPRIARLARTWQRPEEVVVARDACTGATRSFTHDTHACRLLLSSKKHSFGGLRNGTLGYVMQVGVRCR